MLCPCGYGDSASVGTTVPCPYNNYPRADAPCPLRFLDDLDLLLRQPIEVVDEPIDLFVSGVYLALEDLFVVWRPGRFAVRNARPTPRDGAPFFEPLRDIILNLSTHCVSTHRTRHRSHSQERPGPFSLCGHGMPCPYNNYPRADAPCPYDFPCLLTRVSSLSP